MRSKPPVIRVHTDNNRVFSRVEIVSPDGIFVLPGVVKVEQSIAVNDAVRVTIEMLATVEIVPNARRRKASSGRRL
jgi:hypothetical protein